MSDEQLPTNVSNAAPPWQTGWRPVPDPTALTTQVVNEAKADLRREMESLATILRAEMKSQFAENAGLIRGLNDRFDLVEEWRKESKQDTEDARREQKADTEKSRREQKDDAEKALKAALDAAKEAVKEQTTASERAIAKSETTTSDQQRQQYQTITAEMNAINGKVDDLRGRMTTLEAIKLGTNEQRTTQRLDQGSLIAWVVAAIAVAGFLLTYFAK